MQLFDKFAISTSKTITLYGNVVLFIIFAAPGGKTAATYCRFTLNHSHLVKCDL